ncbi:MAG TPA: sugar ABC transporter ATP-binding protein [Candidatus Limnocylindrales bacterium]|jgi:rhamnose transport system ATP-binding protein
MTAAAEPVAEAAVRAQLTDISKQFGATQALGGVSLDLRAGEVHALVGENGAGKSTLVKILAGVHQPDSGTIRIDGEPTVIAGPAQARALGIAVVHQEPRLFPDLSVAENVYIGHAPAGPLRTVDWGATRRAAKALFQELDVRFDVQAPVRGLSMADQQLIEIAKALSFDAGVLILDEPTASLSAHEVERLFTIVRGLRDRGVAILFVSHRLGEVFDLCDTATVFRDGRHVITTATSELTTADLIRHMVGRAVSLFPKVETAVGDVLLEVEGLTRTGEFEDIGFSVRAGEIVGMAGLVGAGRTEVARVLFGIDQRDAGEIRVAGRPVHFSSPSQAMTAGVAYLPEDRHQEGLVLDFSIAENVTLPILPRLFPRLLVRSSVERSVAREYTDQFRVRMTGVDQLVGALSGGNQQKVVLAKWLASKPTVLILDEPTRGIDIGAKVEVHRIISELAASGLAIVLISSDLPEVLAMSDRILVLHEGRITAEIPRAIATEEGVMYAATGNVRADDASDAADG